MFCEHEQDSNQNEDSRGPNPLILWCDSDVQKAETIISLWYDAILVETTIEYSFVIKKEALLLY